MNNYHDNHYAKMQVQPLDVMQNFMTNEEFKAFILGNVIKYHLRAGHKQGEEFSKDIAKRDRYLSWLYYLCEGGYAINSKLDYKLNEDFKRNVLEQIDIEYEKMLTVK